MRIDAAIAPTLRSGHPRASRIAITALLAIAGAFVLAGLVLPSPDASAAVKTVNQCNDINGGPTGATTGLTCTVTVVNTISSGGAESSTTTVTRECSSTPCPPGNGTFTTKSTSLVTNVTQCNDAANDAAPPLVTCRVNITNNISEGTAGAEPVTAATVNQCVGTATGGGKYGANGPLVCDPSGASTTGATVTQCNGSVTGGGSTAVCSVPASQISPAIPVRVNQCNGTGNKGGTLLTCSASIKTNMVAAGEASTPTPSGAAGATPTTPSDQVSPVPSGDVPAGGGSTAGLRSGVLLTLGGVLIMGAIMSGLYRRRMDGLLRPRHSR